MYERSMEKLKVDYIDYYLLHGIGGGMDSLKGRFLDNGVLDFLLKEREEGRIKHLGFSYHGDVRDFDWLLDRQDEYHWDFVQIQMNFLDWRHASMRGGDARMPMPNTCTTSVRRPVCSASSWNPCVAVPSDAWHRN